VEIGERYADRLANDAERLSAYRAAGWFRRIIANTQPRGKYQFHAAEAAWAATFRPRVLAEVVAHYSMGRYALPTTLYKAEKQAQVRLLHDIIGNPFRPLTFTPAWRTAGAVALAQTMYDDRRFDDMPLLADALEEAGCTEEAILKHCREPGEHVRGCWVVDLILDKN
jgi:hypothetical protein